MDKFDRELLTLIRNANRRILNLERETKAKGLFATEQLYNYLDSKPFKLITKGGRITTNISKLTMEQKVGLKTAIENFKEDSSTIREIKKLKKEYESKTGKKLSYKQVSKLENAKYNYQWIYDYMTPSEFWGVWVKLCNEENWSETKFVDELAERINKENDKKIKDDLVAIYYYIKD